MEALVCLFRAVRSTEANAMDAKQGMCVRDHCQVNFTFVAANGRIRVVVILTTASGWIGAYDAIVAVNGLIRFTVAAAASGRIRVDVTLVTVNGVVLGFGGHGCRTVSQCEVLKEEKQIEGQAWSLTI